MDSAIVRYLRSPWFLHFYDIGASTIPNLLVWRCPDSILLSFFQKHIGESAHLDVGVGTGHLLAASARQLTKTKNVTLLDVDPSSLDTAEARLRSAGYKGTIDKVKHNVLLPLPEDLRGKFDSISTFFMLQRLPGIFPVKASHVIADLSAGLSRGGVLYGATVLGLDIEHNSLGRLLMWLYNRRGIFCNRGDSLENLEKALRGYFEEVDVKLVGVVALFEARRPRSK